MAMVKGNFDAILASRSAWLKGVMASRFRKQAPKYTQFFHVESMDVPVIREQSMTELGLATQITTEIPGSWPYEDFELRYNKEWTANWFGNGMQFSKRFVMDEQDSMFAKRGRALVDSMTTTREYYGASVFNNMTSAATAYVLPDGKALAANDHPLKDNVLGGSVSFDNYVGATLDQDSLTDALIMFHNMVDDRGVFVESNATTLMLRPELQYDAAEILNSTLRSDTAENATNVVQGTVTIAPWNYISSPTFWALQGPKHDIRWYNRQADEYETTVDFDDKSLKATIDAMWAYGPFDWRDFVGGNV